MRKARSSTGSRPHRAADPSPFVPGRVAPHHAAPAVLIPFQFAAFRTSISLVDWRGWHAIYSIPSILEFELEYGREQGRFAYNQRHLAEAAHHRRAVIGQFGGLFDLFVPVVQDGRVDQILVVGPLRKGSPSSSEVLQRFRDVTGRQGRAGDRELTKYTSYWLETALFEGHSFAALIELLENLARLIAGTGDAEVIASSIAKLEAPLADASFAHRLWDFTRTLLDPSTARVGASHYWLPRRRALQLKRMPELALVAMIAGRAVETDPVDALIRRHELQRACVKLARTRGEMACSPLGERGVVILLPREPSDARSRAKLGEAAERLTALGRQHDLELHVGVGPSGGAATLPIRYQLALAAAEKALLQGVRSVHAATGSGQEDLLVRDLRRELAQVAGGPAANLRVHFDRYLEAVAVASGYRVDAGRAHLEAGFEHLAEPLVSNGALDKKGFDEMCVALHRAAEEARTFDDLVAAYRDAISDLEQVLRGPSQAHRERSLKRAVEFIREHATEPLSRAQVAHIAGFAPNYLSLLFKRREGVTFEAYVSKLRVERAKQMLVRTHLSIERIARLSGFGSSSHFCRVFKQSVGETPRDYRSRPS